MSNCLKYPQAGLSVEPHEGEAIIFLTIPEDAKAGERVALHTSQKALSRLKREIEECLT